MEGPLTQHRTESKAITTWTVKELEPLLPKLLRGGIRSSRFYAGRSDSLVFSADTQRHRASNAEENRRKLLAELRRLYQTIVPGESDPSKAQKHEQM